MKKYLSLLLVPFVVATGSIITSLILPKDSLLSPSPLNAQQANCNTNFVVSDGYIYWTSGDHLYGATLGSNRVIGQGRAVNTGGWCKASLAVSNGYLYWNNSTDDHLHGVRINGLNWDANSHKVVNTGGWRNVKFAVSENYIYWIKGDDLYGARIDGLQWGETGMVNTGGWQNAEFSVSKGHLYWNNSTDDHLHGVRINDLNWDANSHKVVNTGGWRNVKFAVGDGNLYWEAKGDLHGAGVRGLRWDASTYQIVKEGGLD